MSILYIGGGHDSPSSLYRLSPPYTTPELLSCPLKDSDPIKPYLSSFVTPSHIVFEGEAGTVHANLYMPSSPASGLARPPLLVKAHGGPTSSSGIIFR